MSEFKPGDLVSTTEALFVCAGVLRTTDDLAHLQDTEALARSDAARAIMDPVEADTTCVFLADESGAAPYPNDEMVKVTRGMVGTIVRVKRKYLKKVASFEDVEDIDP